MVYGGFLTLTYSHLHHYWHFPTMVGFCHGGNMLGNHYHRHPHHHRHLAGDLPQEVKSPPDGEIEEGEDDERQQAGQADLFVEKWPEENVLPSLGLYHLIPFEYLPKSRLSKTRCSPGWDAEKSDELFCKKLSNQSNCLRGIKSKEFDRIFISYFSVVLPQPQWVKSIQYSTWKIHLLILLLQDLFLLFFWSVASLFLFFTRPALHAHWPPGQMQQKRRQKRQLTKMMPF